jgi:hypothetical protein
MLPTTFRFICPSSFRDVILESDQWMPSDGKSSHCLWQSELKMYLLSIKCYHLFHRIMLYYILYATRKLKGVTIDLTQYIHILFVLNFIFESLFVPDIISEYFPTRYPMLIKYVDIE